MTIEQPESGLDRERPAKRILFVDDEPRILQGVCRMLRPRRHEWQVETAASGREALEKMAECPFEVVVTDMRMPEMDGAELLKETQSRFPQTIRIILSGHADREASLRSLLVAHQFASKPLAAEDLRATLERACSLSDLIRDEKLRRAVGSIEHLPEPPRAYHQCMQVLEGDDSSVEGITEVIGRDPSLAAKILQVANSAFFGLPQRTSDLDHAISYLGTETILGVVLAVETMRVGGETDPVGPISVVGVSEMSVACAQLSRRIKTGDSKLRQQLYTTALLHDVGYLTLLVNEPDRVAAAVELSDQESIPFVEARIQLGDPIPSRVGAYLLGAWGLPLPMVEAVRDQDGLELEGAPSPVTAWVHLVDRAMKTAFGEARGDSAFYRVAEEARYIEAGGGESCFEQLTDAARTLIEKDCAAA